MADHAKLILTWMLAPPYCLWPALHILCAHKIVPNPVPARLVLCLHAGVPVPQDVVDCLHAKFYASLACMFEAHKHRHPEFAHGKLSMLYSHHDLL